MWRLNHEMTQLIPLWRSVWRHLLSVSYSILNQPKTSYLVHTGRPGRPRREINPEFLALGLDLRGPRGLAPVFDCSARTIRRRALDYGIAQPSPPVYIEYEDEETGQRVRLYHPEREQTPSSSMSDIDLDNVMRHILKIFPSFGRRMITGHLRHMGHQIPRERIRASYERVQGAPAMLISRSVTRRVYRVAGPNALWHHDGQHSQSASYFLFSPTNLMHLPGLIHYRIVIHAFVDGFSRLVTGIRASNNNRAETVLQLFHDARAEHGTPSRVRGDHGTENLRVAEFMETTYGVGRGSYIWGRYVLLLQYILPTNFYRNLEVFTISESNVCGERSRATGVQSGKHFFKTWK